MLKSELRVNTSEDTCATSVIVLLLFWYHYKTILSYSIITTYILISDLRVNTPEDTHATSATDSAFRRCIIVNLAQP